MKIITNLIIASFISTLLFLTNSGAEEKIKIGLIIPLSGENREIGESILNATRLAVNKINMEHQYKGVIELKGVSYRFPDGKDMVFRNANAIFNYGDFVAIVGDVGAGKSSLLKCLTGLYTATMGSILFDDVEIRKLNQEKIFENIGYVNQSIFLIDDTILKNIAFGIPSERINYKSIKRVIEAAKLNRFIDKLPDGLNTKVGERGVQISGGQRQRIGIARALYQNADVIIFDEATSALDNETEKAIIESITELSKNLTIIMVAHRLTTLEGCSTIYQLKDGKIQRSGSFDEIVN